MADLGRVVFNFQMPGVGLIPEYEDRLEVGGVGITPQYFLQYGVFPMLKALGTSRTDLLKAYRRAQAEEQKVAKDGLPPTTNTPEPVIAAS